MEKNELLGCLQMGYDYGKKLIVMWHDYKMQQIRLECANLRKIEESKQYHIEQMNEKKQIRYYAQKQANYEAWKNSPDYDPAKDRYKNQGDTRP